MWRSINGLGWLKDGQSVVGLALGDGAQPEHRQASRLQRAMGVWPAHGLLGRTLRQAPAVIRWVPYRHIPSPVDRSTQDDMPAGFLLVLGQEDAYALGDETVWTTDLPFGIHPGDPGYTPGEDDLACLWGPVGCLLHGRGASQVGALMELADRLQQPGQVAVLEPALVQDAERSGAVWIYPDRYPESAQALVEAADDNQEALGNALLATGVKELLEHAKKPVRALYPKWEAEAGGRIVIYIAPIDSQANTGWFSPEEIAAWAKDEGPMVKDPELDRAFRQLLMQSPTRMDELKMAMEVAGVPPRALRPAWVAQPDGSLEIGFYVRSTPEGMQKLPEGVYLEEDLLDQLLPPIPDDVHA